MLHRPVNYKISIKETFKIPDLAMQYRILRLDPASVILDKDLDFFKSIDCEVREIQLFSGIAETKFSIHIDGFVTTDEIGALNFVISDSHDWSMEWFKRLTNTNLEKLTSAGNTNYMTLKEEECIKIDECSYADCFLVRVDIPHRVINKSNQPRHCLSIRFKNNNFHKLNTQLP